MRGDNATTYTLLNFRKLITFPSFKRTHCEMYTDDLHFFFLSPASIIHPTHPRVCLHMWHICIKMTHKVLGKSFGLWLHAVQQRYILQLCKSLLYRIVFWLSYSSYSHIASQSYTRDVWGELGKACYPPHFVLLQQHMIKIQSSRPHCMLSLITQIRVPHL